MSQSWQITDTERALRQRELDSFLPDRIFDAHAHLHCQEWWPAPAPLVKAGPVRAGLADYQKAMGELLYQRELHALHMGYPFLTTDSTAIAAANAWVANEVSQDPLGRGLLLVRPEDDLDLVLETMRSLQLHGLKPYHLYAPREHTWEAEIPEYLPEPLMALAHAEGWLVMLHLVRSRGIADPSNQYWVRHYCERYPQAQLVLAHCARGFNPYHIMEGLPPLAELANLWVDTSAICQTTGILAVLQIMGSQRVLYGSDFCIAMMRGMAFSIADTFLWHDEQHPPILPTYADDLSLPLVGLENLLAIRTAARLARLNDAEVEGLFWGNAMRLVGK